MKRTKKKEWTRKCEVDASANKNLPVPTQIISNEEFVPPAQTFQQKLVEHRLIELADLSAQKLNISRRQFLNTTGGMAAAFLAMNSVFGKFFNVEASEMFEPQATAEKFPKKQFIFDIHTHHVAAGKQIQVPPLLRYRDASAAWGNKDLQGR